MDFLNQQFYLTQLRKSEEEERKKEKDKRNERDEDRSYHHIDTKLLLRNGVT